MFMLSKEENIKKDKILFSVGSLALAFAVLSITIAPFIVNFFMLNTYVPIANFKIVSGVFYAISLICYLFSSEHSDIQINWIIITFIYFIAFQVLAKMMS